MYGGESSECIYTAFNEPWCWLLYNNLVVHPRHSLPAARHRPPLSEAVVRICFVMFDTLLLAQTIKLSELLPVLCFYPAASIVSFVFFIRSTWKSNNFKDLRESRVSR